MLNVKPGDEVIVTNVNHPSRKARIGRVGSKNIYLDEHRPTPYCRETGRSKDNYGHSRILTLEMHAYQQRVDTAYRKLRDFGVELNHGKIEDDTALAIYDALKPLIEATP